MIPSPDINHRLNDRLTLIITLLAVVMFSVMFVIRQAGAFDFWYWMSTNLVVILSIVFLLDNENLRLLQFDFKTSPLKKMLMGLAFAALLFVVFYLGNIALRIVLDSAGEGINQVYGFKQEAPDWRIVILMLVIIGPGEELFWRGFLQRRLQMNFGVNPGFLVATFLYTAVHLFTGNLVLVLAALTCGLFWGWLYKKHHSMIINIVSHTVWDILVFIVLPFN
ncbi:MAG: CPBP family intramembrane metalloprotease [Bacteroidales bacterium]|nr:CPBP family intramembrane metalloprotease [Bacteroidales bacterium]